MSRRSRVAAGASEAEIPHDAQRFERLLLASEGRPFTKAAVGRVLELATPGARIRVLSIARVHGTAFGMPSPGLLPTKREWAQQREQVEWAIKRLERKGLIAEGHVIGTRNAVKKILGEAGAHGSQAIVMSADPDRGRLVATAMWSQEPQRVRRKSKLPVFFVDAE